VKIVFYTSTKRREIQLAKAFLSGAKTHGVEVERRLTTDIPFRDDYHYACMVGVKSQRLWHMMLDRGITPIMFDKGYCRVKEGMSWRYWRISVGAHNPTEASLMQDYDRGRFEALGFKVRSWRKRGEHILFAGSSAKYHNFYGLQDPSSYARDVVRRLRQHTDRPIVYRPKPSWRDAQPIKGTIFSQSGKPLAQDLLGAHAVVTHGSNACLDAIISGIPTIVLGEGVAKTVSSRYVRDIEKPMKGDRRPLFNAIGYHQWTLDEMESGEAFEGIKRQL
jgi:hypothetical protein